jgi:hypothetical protein
MTTPQFKAKTKTVTRRLGWASAKPGDLLQGVEKSQGLKKGEKVVKLGVIRVLGVRREKLRKMTDDLTYGLPECISEGFPDMTPREFVAMFCKHNKKVTPETVITRIVFAYEEGS